MKFIAGMIPTHGLIPRTYINVNMLELEVVPSKKPNDDRWFIYTVGKGRKQFSLIILNSEYQAERYVHFLIDYIAQQSTNYVLYTADINQAFRKYALPVAIQKEKDNALLL